MFAHVLHGSATLFLFEAIQVNVSVKVIAFMLKHTTHNASALEHDFLAVQINATHTGLLGPAGLVPQSWHGQASLVTVLFAGFLLEYRVQHVANLPIDVV